VLYRSWLAGAPLPPLPHRYLLQYTSLAKLKYSAEIHLIILHHILETRFSPFLVPKIPILISSRISYFIWENNYSFGTAFQSRKIDSSQHSSYIIALALACLSKIRKRCVRALHHVLLLSFVIDCKWVERNRFVVKETQY